MSKRRTTNQSISLTVATAIVLLLLSATGAFASVTVECAKAAPGHAQCDAQIIVKKHASKKPAAKKLVKKAHAISTVAASTAPVSGDPLYMQQAYDLTALSATKGAGDTVAIVDAFSDPNAESDLAHYRHFYKLPVCSTANGCLKIVNQNGQSSPLPAADAAWASEITEDMDAVSAICPNCSIDLVEANSDSSADLASAMQAAASMGANQISDSWSIVGSSSPFGSSIASLLGTGSTSVVAATGDAGELSSSTDAYPAALPDVTAVGGTTLNTDTTSSRGFDESAWSDAGYGCDTNENALSYAANTGCSGRSYADISADADPYTGLNIYQAATGGWAKGGGTSVATPMVAAYEALTGISGTGNQWAYSDANELNDITGSYAGQTGTGTISGDIVAGAATSTNPTVSSVTATTATLSAGIYSNQQATSFRWQYGTTSTYTTATHGANITAGSGVSPVSTMITKLKPSTTYHVRLKTRNASGVTYGYDYTFTTAA